MLFIASILYFMGQGWNGDGLTNDPAILSSFLFYFPLFSDAHVRLFVAKSNKR